MELILTDGTIIEVALTDFNTQYDWVNAKLMCQGMGEGWRLPTIYEIEQIFDNSTLFDFANYGFWAYWTSKEINEVQAFAFSGNEGIIIEESKNEKFYVRAVRTV
jgi:hypothetical protein